VDLQPYPVVPVGSARCTQWEDEPVDELRAAEAVRAAELAKAGHLVRLWRPPLGPDEWRSIGLFRASLPLHIWMKVVITLLNPHPNDPEYRARQAMDHPQV
jgi:muconolactone D-isomerase